MDKKNRILKILFSCFFIFLVFLPFTGTFSQDEFSFTQTQDDSTDLPRQFRGMSLGMPLDDLMTALTGDGYFNFRGERDVSFLPAREQSLVETTGTSFISRAFFQLRDGEVFIMSFSLNTGIIDHYSIFTQFVRNYGQPSYLDPRTAIWENETTRIAIERPLTVRYIDKIVFNDIIDESGLIESGHVQLRQDFLNEF